jgi:branched-chain amino acid aminotransferase
MSGQYVHINGKLLTRKEASVPLYDHGVLYGDGLFEGIRTYGGKVFKLDEHLNRLYLSAKALAIEMSVPQETLRSSILELCRANDHQNGYIRLTVTRGTGLGLDPKHIAGPANVYISNEQLALYPQELYERGLTMITASTRLPSPQIIDPRIKCTGKYANNIQAKLEANLLGAGEAVMLNQQGYVCECTGDNIFIIKDGVVKTPPPHSCGLQGITRDTVIALARKNGIPLEETMMTNYDIYTCDECFLTGTGAEVIPAVALDGRCLGSGRAGELTTRLIQLFREHTREVGTAF